MPIPVSDDEQAEVAVDKIRASRGPRRPRGRPHLSARRDDAPGEGLGVVMSGRPAAGTHAAVNA